MPLKGLALARSYYEECGRAMLAEYFPEYEGRIAVGLVGEGSECFGFDDELSQDHDFGAGFCLWLEDGDYRSIADSLDVAYAKLPSSFRGYPRRELIASGDKRVGALQTTEFYRRFIGLPRAPQTLGEWLALPETFLATCTNGAVFTDPLGAFTEIREALLAYYPEDIRLKKLAVRLGKMAQAGQYNYERSLKRGESVAALHALSEFAENAESAIYLLNRRYKPFYKWAHRGLKNLPRLAPAAALLEEIAGDAHSRRRPTTDAIEELCVSVAAELRQQGLTDLPDGFLLAHAESVRSRIQHSALRALPLFAE